MKNPLKVLLSIPLSAYSGYGNDGIALTKALVRAGADVYLKPSHVDPPLDPEIAWLLTKRLEKPFDLIIDHKDPAALGVKPEAAAAADITVGWTMWEYSNFDNLQGKDRKTLRQRIANYDLLLGYDPVSTGALADYVPKRGRKVALSTLQGGFDPTPWKPVERDWFGPGLNFCMVGQLHERKDPFVAIQAFVELWNQYPDEFQSSRLSLKTNVPGLHSKLNEMCPGIKVYYETWTTEKLYSFYQQHHVILSPSRGEGKCLPPLEMQTTGGVAVATNWSGPAMWLNSEYSFPLNYTIRPVNPQFPNCLNARADKDHLKEIMLYSLRNRSELKRMGELAARIIPEQCNWDAVVGRLMRKVGELNSKGAGLEQKYLAGVREQSDDE